MKLNKKITMIFILSCAYASYANAEMKVGDTEVIKLKEKPGAVAVGKSGVLDYEMLDDESILLTAKSQGASDVIITDNEGNTIVKKGYNVTNTNFDNILREVKKIDRNAKVRLDLNGDSYIITGNSSTYETTKRICEFIKNALSKKIDNAALEINGDGNKYTYWKNDNITEQVKCLINSDAEGKSLVNVKIKMVEIDKAFVDKLGIDWLDSLMLTGSVVVGKGVGDITGVLTALTKSSKSKIISEPNITVIPGELATFNSGGELPVITISDGGDAAVSFKKYGVQLNVIANLIDENRMRIFLSTEMSSVDPSNSYERSDGAIMPALKSQSANTIVNITNGQTFAIGGLKSIRNENNDSGVMFLSKIPVIGSLFKTVEDNREDKEIIIIATVNKIEPSKAEIKLPETNFKSYISRSLNVNADKIGLNVGPDLN